MNRTRECDRDAGNDVSRPTEHGFVRSSTVRAGSMCLPGSRWARQGWCFEGPRGSTSAGLQRDQPRPRTMDPEYAARRGRGDTAHSDAPTRAGATRDSLPEWREYRKETAPSRFARVAASGLIAERRSRQRVDKESTERHLSNHCRFGGCDMASDLSTPATDQVRGQAASPLSWTTAKTR